jgi:hypothetical protein
MKKRERTLRRQPVLASTQQALDVFKPRRDRKVGVRGIACPDCEAGIEQDCLTGNGKKTQHPARRRMAIRAGL